MKLDKQPFAPGDKVKTTRFGKEGYIRLDSHDGKTLTVHECKRRDTCDSGWAVWTDTLKCPRCGHTLCALEEYDSAWFRLVKKAGRGKP